MTLSPEREARAAILESVWRQLVRAKSRLDKTNQIDVDDSGRDWKVGQAYGAWRELLALWRNLKRRGLR